MFHNTVLLGFFLFQFLGCNTGSIYNLIQLRFSPHPERTSDGPSDDIQARFISPARLAQASNFVAWLLYFAHIRETSSSYVRFFEEGLSLRALRHHKGGESCQSDSRNSVTKSNQLQ